MMKRTARSRRRAQRAFTFAELVIAGTAALIVIIAAFQLARQATAYFQQEARVATAQFSGAVGFERLRSDVARAGFNSSPAARYDPKVCGAISTWYQGMQQLAAVRVWQGLYTADSFYAANSLSPDRLDLSGSYSTIEKLPINTISPQGNGSFQVLLNTKVAAYPRATGATADSGWLGGTPSLATIFNAADGSGRMVRIVDGAGNHNYAMSGGVGTDGNGNPYVTITANPGLVISTGGGVTDAGVGGACGVSATGTSSNNQTINPVSWIRYDVRDLSNPGTLAGYGTVTGLQALYDAGGVYSTDAFKRDLIRVELASASNAAGTASTTSLSEIAASLEVVAENAVDLRVGITYVASTNAGTAAGNSTAYDITLASSNTGNANVGVVAGAPPSGAAPAQTSVCNSTSTAARPHCLRSLRVRVGIRAREFDRVTGVSGFADAGLGVLRVGQPDASTYARVRNFVADVQLPNLAGVTW